MLSLHGAEEIIIRAMGIVSIGRVELTDCLA